MDKKGYIEIPRAGGAIGFNVGLDMSGNLVISTAPFLSEEKYKRYDAKTNKIINVEEFVFKYKSPFKTGAVGTIKNVRISPEGVIEWDSYKGATSYSVTVDKSTTYIKNGTKCDINSDLTEQGTHKITVNAIIKSELGSVTAAIWNGCYPQITNPMSVKGKTAKVKYKKLRKKNQKVLRSKVMTISDAKGNISYKLTDVKRGKSKKYKKYFKINAATGKVTVKKKLRKGTYKITCSVTDPGNGEYESSTKTVTFKIKVR